MPITPYERRCAITGERTLPVLEAAHIKPFSIGPTAAHNGLLLRADIHTLYYKGLLIVAPGYRLEVSRRIQEQYGNGKECYALHGKELVVVPQLSKDQPGKDLLDWYCREVYVNSFPAYAGITHIAVE